MPETAAALNILAGSDVDAVLLDVTVRDGTTVPVTIELGRRTTPFVVLTAYDDDLLDSAYRSAPALAKPAKLSTVVSTLTALITK